MTREWSQTNFKMFISTDGFVYRGWKHWRDSCLGKVRTDSLAPDLVSLKRYLPKILAVTSTVKNSYCKFMKGKYGINKKVDVWHQQKRWCQDLRDSSFLLLEHSCAFWAVPAPFRFWLESHAAEVEPLNRTILVVAPVDIQLYYDGIPGHKNRSYPIISP